MVKWEKEVDTMVFSRIRVAILVVAAIYIAIISGVIRYSHAVERGALDSGLDRSTSISIGILGYAALICGIVLCGFCCWKAISAWRAYRSIRHAPPEYYSW